MALEVKRVESRRILPKRKRGKCEIYLPPSPVSLSTPTAQASPVPGLADGLGIVLVSRDKAIIIVTVYFKRNYPPGNPEFKKKKRRSRKNFTLDIKSEHLFEVCSEKNLSLKNIKGRVIAGKKKMLKCFSPIVVLLVSFHKSKVQHFDQTMANALERCGEEKHDEGGDANKT